MNTKFIFVNILLLGLSGLSLLQAVQADDDYLEAKRLQELGEILPLESILKTIRTTFPGRIIEVDIENKKKIIVYEVEILGKDGVVREVYIDARTGKVLSVKDEN